LLPANKIKIECFVDGVKIINVAGEEVGVGSDNPEVFREIIDKSSHRS
jgi:hypothetical protein